jgi:hypothetical protein
MKTYPYVMSDELKLFALRNKAAIELSLTVQFSIAWYAHYNMLTLEYIAKHGVPDVYKAPDERMWDFFSNFSYDPTARRAAMDYMAQHFRDRLLAVRLALSADWGPKETNDLFSPFNLLT